MTDEHEKPILSFNPDRPIKKPDEDKLGRKAFAEDIAEKILNYDNECPLVLGVYGSWGYGKTSLLNLIRFYVEQKTEIKGDNKIEIFELSPWSYSHGDQIIAPFIKEIADKFDKKAQSVSRDYSTLFTNLSTELNLLIASLNMSSDPKIVAIANTVSLLLAAHEWGIKRLFPWKKGTQTPDHNSKSIAEAKKDISELLKTKKNFKIVLIVDDLDRLLADEIRQLFQAIKSIINLPNLIFILAMDDIEVGKLISHEGFSGRDYIEKIVQIPIYVPYPDRNKFEERLSNQIELIKTYFSKDRWDSDRLFSIYHGGLKEILLENANLRQFYRMMNQICINLEKMQMDVNPIDYIAIEAIKVYHPIVYRFIYRNKLVFLGSELNIAESFSNEPADKKDKAAIIDEFNKFNSHVKKLLPLLFPRFSLNEDSSVDNGENNSFWQKERRICSGHYFENYFLQEIPDDQVSQEIIDFFIVGNQRYSAYYEKLEKLILEKSFDNFIIRINSGLDFSQGWQKNELFLSLINISEKYDVKRIIGLDTLDHFIAGIFKKYISTFHIQSRENIITEIIYNAKALYMPLIIILELHAEYSKKGDEPKSEENNIITSLSAQWARKVESAFKDNSLKSFKGLSSILYYWNKWSKNDHVELFIEQISDSRVILNLLGSYVYEDESKIDIKQLFELNIADKIYSKISSIKVEDLAERDNKTIRLFQQSYMQFINSDEYRNLKKLNG